MSRSATTPVTTAPSTTAASVASALARPFVVVGGVVRVAVTLLRLVARSGR